MKKAAEQSAAFLWNASLNGKVQMLRSASDVTYPDFPKRGAFVPRSRSANQNAPIATNARRKNPPHDRNVTAKLVSMTFSGER
jgi:hypothetical protein